MHIINLTIECKEATGDGTVIVCMNQDYVVRIAANDCGSFTEAPVKKLIIRHGKEYAESTITEVTENGQTYLQAVLPVVEKKDYIDLGVCGKDTDDPDEIPIYTSKSARFACEKSILCGTAIVQRDPKYGELIATENGNYKSTEHGVDGFNEVTVSVPLPIHEDKTVNLDFSKGSHTVLPTYQTYVMDKVTIEKPLNLIPEHILKGVNIAGVVGTLEVTPVLEKPEFDGTVVINNA